MKDSIVLFSLQMRTVMHSLHPLTTLITSKHHLPRAACHLVGSFVREMRMRDLDARKFQSDLLIVKKKHASRKCVQCMLHACQSFRLSLYLCVCMYVCLYICVYAYTYVLYMHTHKIQINIQKSCRRAGQMSEPFLTLVFLLLLPLLPPLLPLLLFLLLLHHHL